MFRKRLRLMMLTFGLLIGAVIVHGDNAPSDPSDVILKYLGDTIDWYRRVTSFAQAPVNTDEVLFRDTVAQGALQTLKLGFTFAHADAGLLAATRKASPMTAPTTNGSSLHNVQQAVDAAAARVAQFQSELNEIDQQWQTAPPTSQPALHSRREKVSAELELAILRQHVLQGFAAFSSDQGARAPARSGRKWTTCSAPCRSLPAMARPPRRSPPRSRPSFPNRWACSGLSGSFSRFRIA